MEGGKKAAKRVTRGMFQWEVKQRGLFSRYVSLPSENSQIKSKPLFPLSEARVSVPEIDTLALFRLKCLTVVWHAKISQAAGVEDPVTLMVLVTPTPLPGVHALSSPVWGGPITSFKQKDVMEGVLCQVQAPVLGSFCFGMLCFIRASTTLGPTCC